MSPMLKTILVATLCLSNIANLALASEKEGAQVIFFDPGDDCSPSA